MSDSRDLTNAMSLAVGAVVLGSFLPWAHMVVTNVKGTDGDGNLTLLLAGIAGALLARWRLDGGAHRGLMTASLALCVTTSGVLLYNLAQVMQTAAEPQSGLLLATTGALIATALAAVLRRRTLLVTI